MTNATNNSQPAADSAIAAPTAAGWLGGATTPSRFAAIQEADALHGEIRGISQQARETSARLAHLSAIGKSSADYAVQAKAFRELANLCDFAADLQRRAAQVGDRLRQLGFLKGR